MLCSNFKLGIPVFEYLLMTNPLSDVFQNSSFLYFIVLKISWVEVYDKLLLPQYSEARFRFEEMSMNLEEKTSNLPCVRRQTTYKHNVCCDQSSGGFTPL
jgi:hypothetical protein